MIIPIITTNNKSTAAEILTAKMMFCGVLAAAVWQIAPEQWVDSVDVVALFKHVRGSRSEHVGRVTVGPASDLISSKVKCKLHATLA